MRNLSPFATLLSFSGLRPSQGASVCAVMIGIILSSLVQGARAEVVLINISEPTFNAIGIGSTSAYAQKFTTGTSELGYNLNSIGLNRQILENDVPIVMGIYADSGTAPNMGSGVLLQQTSFGTGVVTVEYSPSSPLTLDANTSYWIVLSAPPGQSSGGFNVTSSSNYSAAPGWTYHSTAMGGSSNGGVNWTMYARAIKLDVDATAIPEPSTWALITITGLGAILLRRRQAARRETS